MTDRHRSDVVARAPGRVNLIGDHTDTTGGWVLPMAIDLATTVEARRGGQWVVLSSDDEAGDATVPLGVEHPEALEPPWARYVGGVVAELGPSAVGLRGRVHSQVPLGAGLSSSAALEVAVALAAGFDGGRLPLARLAQRAEQRATGVPCGIMDQLASVAGVAGHALLIDCTELSVSPVRIPDDVEVVVVHSGQARRLAGSPYAERRRSVEQAEAVLGPLRQASPSQLAPLDDADPTGLLRRRARHVVSENARVRAAAAVLDAGDGAEVGRLMVESHASLRDDFEVSTDALDALVEELSRRPGVLGARLTGAGFGGCAVALCRPGTLDDRLGRRAWRVRASGGARIVSP